MFNTFLNITEEIIDIKDLAEEIAADAALDALDEIVGIVTGDDDEW